MSVILDRSPTQEAIETAAALGCAFFMLGYGRFCLLDFEDYEIQKGFRWHYQRRKYAARLQHVSQEMCDRLIYLHREIFQPEDGVTVDHINRNRLDNRRSNLRSATRRQQAGNAKKRIDGVTSGFRGVCFDASRGKFMAQGRTNGKFVYLGRYDAESEAALAYNRWASDYYGEFANLNPV